MAKSKTRPRSKPREIEDYIARIDRTAPSYGISNYHQRYEQPYPNRRALYLFGRMLLPGTLHGLDLEVTLIGREPRPDAPPPEALSSTVAHLERRRDRVHVFAQLPPDYVPTLSAAFQDQRLCIFCGRGPALFRRSSLLIDISFEEESHFTEYWGEPLPLLKAGITMEE